MTDHHPHQLTSAADVNRFMFAGKATLTLVSIRTGGRFTYKVSASEDGRVHFVALMNGADNEASFQYMGHWRNGEYTHGRKSRIGEDAPAAKAYQWFASNYDIEGAFDLVEVWHEGACGRCGRKLTVPESIESGIGPECANQMGMERPASKPRAKGKPRVPKRTPAAALRAAERAQSPDGRAAVSEGKVGLPFPNDVDWVRKFASGEVTL